MTELNMFAGDDQSNQQTQEDVDYEAQLIGEGKRYRDTKIAAKALVDKDAHIARLEAELKGARSALKGEQKIDEFLDQVKNLKPATPSLSNPNNQQEETAGNQNINTSNSTTSASVSLQDVEALLEKREANRTKAENFAFAVDQVKAAFGADYKATLASITMSLGTTPEFMNELAQTQPQAFLKLVGANPVPKTNAPGPSTVRTAGLTAGSGSNEKDSKYYQALKKQMGTEAFFADKKLQTELHRNAQRLGEAFFN